MYVARSFFWSLGVMHEPSLAAIILYQGFTFGISTSTIKAVPSILITILS